LTLTYHPNLDTPPTDLSQATQQYFTSFDLQGGRGAIALFVPYLSKFPYRSVFGAGGESSLLNNVHTAFNGCIALRVQNPLRGSPTVAGMVNFNIYKYAAPDFRLKVFGSIRNDLGFKKKELDKKKKTVETRRR